MAQAFRDAMTTGYGRTEPSQTRGSTLAAGEGASNVRIQGGEAGLSHHGPLAEGTFDPATCTVECPRHGSLFDLATGKPKTLPAYVPVDTFPVIIENDTIKLEVE